MNKRLLILIAFLFLFAPLYAKSALPNIVYILADDLGIGDLGCYGQKKLTTPNIDALAADGLKFDRHYSGSSVCAPSRCTLLTGLHTGHCDVRANAGSKFDEGQAEMDKETKTVAHLLKESGYKTGAFGKWGLGAQLSYSSPMAMGFDEFFGYNCQSHAHNYYPEYLWKNSEKVTLKENLGGKRNLYSADLIHSELMKFLKSAEAKYKSDGQPFFIYYAMTLPHAELAAPEERLEAMRGRFAPETPYVNKSAKKHSYHSQETPHAAFAAMVDRIDAYVADIVSELKKSGLYNNTLIVFSSDNGAHMEGGHDPVFWNSNGGLRGIKRDLYEGGVRTPMILVWKNKVAAGRTTGHVSAFWDIMPTFAEIVGKPDYSKTDGISFLPLINNMPQKKHDYLYWEFHERGGKQAVLKDGFKLVKLFVNIPDKTVFELYNLADDPSESKNLVKSNPQKFAELKALMDGARTVSPNAKFNFKNGK